MLEIFKNFTNWKKINGYSNRKIYKKTHSFDIVKYDVLGERKHCNKRIVFFSDLHVQDVNFNQLELAKNINLLKPNWIIFGGDLITSLQYQKETQTFLSCLSAKNGKLAVLGNWEKRRLRWIPTNNYINFFKNSDFMLLVNSSYSIKYENFIGLLPQEKNYLNLNKRKSNFDFECVISHIPADNLTFLKTDNKPNLIISGHTHGGQIRIPGFGAVYTSSRLWKLFEYGHYFHKKLNCNMIISSGIGFTGINKRLFCRPEILLIDY